MCVMSDAGFLSGNRGYMGLGDKGGNKKSSLASCFSSLTERWELVDHRLGFVADVW